MKKEIVYLLVVVLLLVGVHAQVTADLSGGNIFNIFENVTILNDSVWKDVNGTVTLRQPASILNITSGILFLSGNASVFELDIRNPASLTFDSGQFSLSAQDFIFQTGGVRRQIVSDSDFAAIHNLSNGTSYLSVQNPSKTPLSKASINGVNSDNTGFSFVKSNSLAVEPNIFEVQNNGGYWDFIQGPMKPNLQAPFIGKEIRIGFYDNFILDENLSIIEFVNKTYYLTINHTKGVIVNSNLTVEGDLLYNEIFGELFFPENGDLNITINTLFTYMNITPLTDGYVNSITLSSSTFIIQQNGTYFGSFDGALIDGSASDYGVSIFVNEVEQERTHAHMTTVTSSRYTNFGGQGTFSAIEGDVINLRVQDESSPARDADFNNLDFIVRRIGK